VPCVAVIFIRLGALKVKWVTLSGVGPRLFAKNIDTVAPPLTKSISFKGSRTGGGGGNGVYVPGLRGPATVIFAEISKAPNWEPVGSNVKVPLIVSVPPPGTAPIMGGEKLYVIGAAGGGRRR
jgi:hypothetical protein